MAQADITTTELEEFDRGWLEVIQQTPWIQDLYVPFRVEETCQATGTPIRIDFVPDGVKRVEPAEAVTILLSVEDIRPSTPISAAAFGP